MNCCVYLHAASTRSGCPGLTHRPLPTPEAKRPGPRWVPYSDHPPPTVPPFRPAPGPPPDAPRPAQEPPLKAAADRCGGPTPWAGSQGSRPRPISGRRRVLLLPRPAAAQAHEAAARTAGTRLLWARRPAPDTLN